jgi:hypothetical protein
LVPVSVTIPGTALAAELPPAVWLVVLTHGCPSMVAVNVPLVVPPIGPVVELPPPQAAREQRRRVSVFRIVAIPVRCSSDPERIGRSVTVLVAH